MVQKIHDSDWLKRMDNMTLDERQAYEKRVVEWLETQSSLLAPKAVIPEAAFQNVGQLSVMWNESECKAWNDGVRLLTALTSTVETWLPEMLYMRSAKRAIRQMTTVLRGFCLQCNEHPAEEEKTVVHKVQTVTTVRETVKKENTLPAANARAEKLAPVRPKHIDQYVHLLPRKTQERASLVKDLLRQLDIARENARLLMNDGSAKGDDIAKWSRLATKCDDEVRSIYRELDSEWEKLVKEGRVVVDDLGNARAVEVIDKVGEEVHREKKGDADVDAPKLKRGRPTKDEAAARALAKKQAAIAKMTDEEKEKRLEYLKKWLRDTRTKKSPKHDKQWAENCSELVMLGGEVTDAILRAARTYGIDVSEGLIVKPTNS